MAFFLLLFDTFVDGFWFVPWRWEIQLISPLWVSTTKNRNWPEIVIISSGESVTCSLFHMSSDLLKPFLLNNILEANYHITQYVGRYWGWRDMKIVGASCHEISEGKIVSLCCYWKIKLWSRRSRWMVKDKLCRLNSSSSHGSPGKQQRHDQLIVVTEYIAAWWLLWVRKEVCEANQK